MTTEVGDLTGWVYSVLDWPGLVLFILAWPMVSLVAAGLFNLIKIALDRLFPDTLPHGVLPYVRELLKQHDLLETVKVLKGPPMFNAFFPIGNAVILDRTILERKDPFFWAIGAHEVGHVLFYHRHPFIHKGMMIGRKLYKHVSKIGRMTFLAGAFFIGTSAADAAHSIIAASMIAGALVLIDEMLASAIALNLLRKSLSPRQMWSATLGLLAAFGTYVASILADGIFLLYFDEITRWYSDTVSVAFYPEVSSWDSLTQILWTVVLGGYLVTGLVSIHLKSLIRDQNMEIWNSLATLFFLQAAASVVDGPTGATLFCIATASILPALSIPLQFIGAILFIPLAFTRVGKKVVDWIKEWSAAMGPLGAMSYKNSLSTRVIVLLTRITWLPFVIWFWLQ